MIACHKKLCAMITSLDKTYLIFFCPLITYLGRSVDPRRTLDFMALHQTFHKAYPDYGNTGCGVFKLGIQN